jgi:hypothetical protein
MRAVVLGSMPTRLVEPSKGAIVKGGVRAERRESRAVAILVAIAAWIVGMLLQFHPMLLSGLRRIQGDFGDTRLNNYTLEHGYRWLFGFPRHEQLWSPPVFYPVANTAAYSDVLLGVAPFYWPWRIAGLEPDTAYQLWLLTIATLNFLSGLLLFSRGFRCRPIASAVAAMLLSFASLRTAQLMHAQLIPHFYIAIAILAALEIFDPAPTLRAGVVMVERKSAWVFVLAAAAVAQLYSGYYLGWYLVFALALAVLWALVIPATRRRFLVTVRANAGAITAAALGSGLLLVPMAVHYLRAKEEVGSRSFSVVESMLPRLQSWLNMGGESWLYGWLASYDAFRNLPMSNEHRLGIGAVTVACAVCGLWMARRRRAVQLAVIVPLTMALLATEWPGGFAPWHAIYSYVPGAAALRAVARIGIAPLFPASLGVALLIDALLRMPRIPPSRAALILRRRDLQRRALIVVILVAAIVAEQGARLESYDKYDMRARVARVVNGIGPGCTLFVYMPAEDGDPQHFHADAMWASMERGIPTLNGYSGNQPPEWPFANTRAPTPSEDSAVNERVSRWAAKWHLDAASICRVRTPPS